MLEVTGELTTGNFVEKVRDTKGGRAIQTFVQEVMSKKEVIERERDEAEKRGGVVPPVPSGIIGEGGSPP